MIWGLLLVAVGLALRSWSMATLYKVGIGTLEFSDIIKPLSYTYKGPYRFMRHPAYLGSMMVLAGLGVLALGLQGAVIAVAAWPFYASRIYAENQLRGQ